MSFALNAVFNPKLTGSLVPPPVVLNLEVTVQAATAEQMTADVRRALLDVQLRNDEILAKFGQPGLKLGITDVVLAGGGDGHTFVTTIFFSPAEVNILAQLLSILTSSPPPDLSPENWDFEFALAGTGEALPALYTPLFQAACDAATKFAGSDVSELLTLFNLSAGAAKGTRFMAGIGALMTAALTNTTTRNPVDSTTPVTTTKLQAIATLLKNQKALPADPASASSSMMNLLGLKR